MTLPRDFLEVEVTVQMLLAGTMMETAGCMLERKDGVHPDPRLLADPMGSASARQVHMLPYFSVTQVLETSLKRHMPWGRYYSSADE